MNATRAAAIPPERVAAEERYSGATGQETRPTKFAPERVPEERCAEATLPPHPQPLSPAGERGERALRIVWQGTQDAVHSLALVNRSLCAALAERGHELSLLPASGTQPPSMRVALPASLVGCVGRALSNRIGCPNG